MPDDARRKDWKNAYAILNTGAHRKHWPLLGAPGVVQHLAFRMPTPSVGLPSVGGSPRDEWHKEIDTFLTRLFLLLLDDALTQSGSPTAPKTFVCPNWHKAAGTLYLLRHQFAQADDGTPMPSRLAIELGGIGGVSRAIRYEIFTLLTNFRGIPLTVRAELRHEFWTLSFLADFSHHDGDLPASSERDRMVLAFGSLAALFSGSAARTTEPGADQALKKKLFAAGDALTGQFPDLLRRELIEPCYRYVNPTRLGDKFADFRGIATRVNIAPDHAGAPVYTMADALSVRPGARPPLDAIAREPVYDGAHALRIVDTLWPAVREIFARHDPGDARRRHDKPEFSICRMQGSRSLYISSLGRYTSNEADPVEPVRFMLVTSSRSRWQLGRLAERITHLGTLRLAAIYDIEDIQDASDSLERLVSKWQNAQVGLPAFRGGGARLAVAEDVLHELNEIERSVRGGLMSRISRSAYYVETFNDVLRDMRIDPVDGFQTYPVFVRRRMGATFDFVKRVGRRRDALHKDILLFFDGETARQTMRGVKATQRLLKRAEWFLAVSAVYYGGSIIAQGFEVLAPDSDHRWQLAGYAFVALIAIVLLAREHLKRKEST